MAEQQFQIKLKDFYEGLSPHAGPNPLTSKGSKGQASVMQNMNVILADSMFPGKGLTNLSNGTQAGVVTELINHILDKAVAADTTYGIGPTKLFQISSTAVASSGTWPHTITNATDGESVVDFNGNIYYFYNKASGADIGKYDQASTFDDDWGSTVPTGAAALQSAVHPVAVKEDLMVFGNGQYLGTYTGETNTLAPTKLDFKAGQVVADVCFNGNQWVIAVNSGVSGNNQNHSDIFLWGGAAINSILDDQLSVGPNKIGFLYPLGGVVFVAYQDLSDIGSFKIGYINGRQLKTLGYFTGTLPNFAQKTTYLNTILFLSGGLVFSAGAYNDELPLQLSQFADGGYATCGALASPFGTPMIASTDGGSNFRLAKFFSYETASVWKSLVIPVVNGRLLGYIDDITVLTNNLQDNSASCSLTVEYNQATSTSTAKTITTAGKTLHRFNMNIKNVEDFRIALDFSAGSSSYPVEIREIIIDGHYYERD